MFDSTEQVDNTKRYISTTLLKGFLVLLPITVIILVVGIVFRFIFSLLMPISALIDPGTGEPHWLMHILSLAVLLFFVFIVGVGIRNKFGRAYFRKFEKTYLMKIPLYSLIYDFVYQFAGLKKIPFTQVVLIDPFQSGVLMTGFVTEQISTDLFSIFVPTAPNPTNGNIYHVPKSAIKFLKADAQDAMRTVVGMGTGTSDFFIENIPDTIEGTNPPRQVTPGTSQEKV